MLFRSGTNSHIDERAVKYGTHKEMQFIKCSVIEVDAVLPIEDIVDIILKEWRKYV